MRPTTGEVVPFRATGTRGATYRPHRAFIRGRSVRPTTAHRSFPKFPRNLGDLCRFLRKIKIFPKIFIIFTHFSNERNLSIAKGRSPIRARVRTQAGEIKTGESRHASIRQKSGWLDSRATSWRRPKRELLVTDQPLRRRRHSSARPRLIVGTPDPWSNEAGPEAHPPRARLPKLAFRVSELLCSPQRADI